MRRDTLALDLADGAAATRARLAGLAMHGQVAHLDINIFTHPFAKCRNRFTQHGPHSRIESSGLLAVQISAATKGVELRRPKNLIGISIADTGDKRLIGEYPLAGPIPT